MSGIKMFGDKRALNTIEVGFFVQSLEFNKLGMQIMTGFAQVAKESEVRKYFIEGKELSKKIITICAESPSPLGVGWIARSKIYF